MRSLRLVLGASALFLLPAACGDDGGGTAADAGDQIDADDTDADTTPAVGTCGIVVDPRMEGEVLFGGTEEPLAGHPVVFTGPDGAILGTATTDAGGAASFDSCVTDTAITAVIPHDLRSSGGRIIIGPSPAGTTTYGDRFGITYTHVQPNDTVYYGPEVVADDFVAPVNTSINVTIPAATAFPQADNVRVSVGCDRTSSDPSGEPHNVRLDVDAFQGRRCFQDDGTVDVWAVLTAYNDGEQALAYAFANDITPAANGSTVVNLGDWTAGDATSAFVAVNFPTQTDEAEARGEQWLGPVLHAVDEDYDEPPLVSLSRRYFGPPPGFGGRTASYAWAEDSAPDYPLSDSRISVTKLGNYSQSTFIDMTEDALPYVTGVVLSQPSGLPQINWQSSRPIGEATMTMIELFLEVREFDKVSAQDSAWVIVTPSAAEGFIQAPPLSPEVQAALLPEGPVVVEPHVVAVEVISTDVASYQELITTEGFRPEYVGSGAQELLFEAGTGVFKRSWIGRFFRRLER